MFLSTGFMLLHLSVFFFSLFIILVCCFHWDIWETIYDFYSSMWEEKQKTSILHSLLYSVIIHIFVLAQDPDNDIGKSSYNYFQVRSFLTPYFLHCFALLPDFNNYLRIEDIKWIRNENVFCILEWLTCTKVMTGCFLGLANSCFVSYPKTKNHKK